MGRWKARVTCGRCEGRSGETIDAAQAPRTTTAPPATGRTRLLKSERRSTHVYISVRLSLKSQHNTISGTKQRSTRLFFGIVRGFLRCKKNQKHPTLTPHLGHRPRLSTARLAARRAAFVFVPTYYAAPRASPTHALLPYLNRAKNISYRLAPVFQASKRFVTFCFCISDSSTEAQSSRGLGFARRATTRTPARHATPSVPLPLPAVSWPRPRRRNI
jgi:hypothetical protein